MPFQSKAQQKFMFSQHPDIAKRWAGETPDMKSLPARKKKATRDAMGALRSKYAKSKTPME